jgi:UDP-N-acetylglucosamine 3-dehydrogenase
MTTRVAVIGVGMMGREHARVFAELPDVELVAVCDSYLENARAVGHKYGAPAYQDYMEMLQKEIPDAVTIAVPTALHKEVTIRTLKTGTHVLVEKPIAPSLDEAREMIDRAHELNRVLMVGQVVRFNPALQLLKEKLKSGQLGRVFQIFCRRAEPFPARVRDVGVVVDLAPHDVDIMRFLLDQEPKRVYAETEQRLHTEHEDLIFGLLRFPEGVTGALEINWLTPTRIHEVLVLGERGLFRVDNQTQDLYFYENADAVMKGSTSRKTIKTVSEGEMVRYALQRNEPLKVELQEFLRAVRGDVPAQVTGEDGLAALRLALALVESGITHQVIEV